MIKIQPIKPKPWHQLYYFLSKIKMVYLIQGLVKKKNQFFIKTFE